jgi:choline kinase
MRAVILAAGRGLRLRDVVGDRPKCLARVGSCTLLERQIRSLRGCGLDDIAVVAGFRADDIRAGCGPDVDVVVNADYDATDSLYSMSLARELIGDGFIVLNGDVLFHDQLLWDLLTARDQDALLMSASRGETYTDEEMKIRVRSGCVAEIAKTLPPAAADGENVGIAKFGADGAAVLLEVIDRLLVNGGGRRDWLPRAFGEFALRRPLRVIDTRGYPWIEIDNPEDYWQACGVVLPAILNFEPARAQPRVGPTRNAGDGAGRLTSYV